MGDNQNGDLNGSNASNGHDLDEAEEGVKNAAKNVLDVLNNRENDNTAEEEEVKRDSTEEVDKAEKEKTSDEATPAEDKSEESSDLQPAKVEVEVAEVPAKVEEQEVFKSMET